MAVARDVEHGHDIASTGQALSARFSEFAATLSFDDLPENVVAAARRGLLDWLGCAIAGSRHGTIDRLLDGLDLLHSSPLVPAIARGRRLGLLEAALANGQMGHVLDLDDTHMDVFVLHTSSPSLAALLSAASSAKASGRGLLVAYVLAFEAGIRVGRTAPHHHERGWHLTGTLGTIAAGVAAARLLGLDASRMNNALALSATQASGMKQNRGTMAKSFHAGRAAANGLLAALLASRDLTASTEIVEGRRGFAYTFSDGTADYEALVRDLGSDWKILRNGYKPHACGVLLHPLIDAVSAFTNRLAPERIDRLEVEAHPSALRVTGVENPTTGLEGKFSIRHAAAVGLLDGSAGIAQFTDARVADPAVVALRGKVSAIARESFRPEEARVRLVERDGTTHEIHVPWASGTRENPMSDAALAAKFRANAEPVVGPERAALIASLVDRLDTPEDLAGLLDALV